MSTKLETDKINGCVATDGADVRKLKSKLCCQKPVRSKPVCATELQNISGIGSITYL